MNEFLPHVTMWMNPTDTIYQAKQAIVNIGLTTINTKDVTCGDRGQDGDCSREGQTAQSLREKGLKELPEVLGNNVCCWLHKCVYPVKIH